MARRPRNYGWSPEQLARINARREARGQDLYIDEKMGGLDYMDKYKKESLEYAERKQKNQNKPAFSSERFSPLSQYTGRESLRDKMSALPSIRERMQNESRLKQVSRAVESEDEKRKRKGGMGVGTPNTLQDSYNRVTA